MTRGGGRSLQHRFQPKNNFRFDNSSAKLCSRCGHKSHRIKDCQARMHRNGSVLPALSNQGAVKNPSVKNMSGQTAVNSTDQSVSKLGNYAENYGIFLEENIDNFAQDICSLILLSDDSPNQTL